MAGHGGPGRERRVGGVDRPQELVVRAVGPERERGEERRCERPGRTVARDGIGQLLVAVVIARGRGLRLFDARHEPVPA